jgi:hypothetical protein
MSLSPCHEESDFGDGSITQARSLVERLTACLSSSRRSASIERAWITPGHGAVFLAVMRYLPGDTP